MEGTTGFQGKPTRDDATLAGDVRKRNAQIRRDVAIAFWLIGFIALVVISVIVRSHPAPWPFDLQTTVTMQQLQPLLPSWVSNPIVWASIVDNPIPSIIGFVLWFVGLSLIGVVAWRRGRSPIPWFVTAIFVSLGPGVMAGLDRIMFPLGSC